MCGIFAYSGSKKTDQVLIQGLKQLEYRGYDSAGMAFFEEGKIQCYRVCGGIDELVKILPNTSKQKQLGIGHTRWATHGKPSKINAHPHKGGSIYVVHNGVIENKEQIERMIFSSQTHSSSQLISETDTEIIPHLIQFFIESERLDFFEAVLKSLPLLKGSYAVVALSEKHPDQIIAFKSGPPLILAKDKEDFFISSDLQALDASWQVLFLEDEEILHLKNNQVQLFNFKGESLKRDFQKNLKKKNQTSNKKQHPHFMIKEILEQPEVLSSVISTHLNKEKSHLQLQLSKGDLEVLNPSLKTADQLLILACGSSYFAGMFAKYVLEEFAGLPVQVETASEFIYRKPSLLPRTLVLFISQSGETADILSAFKQVEKLCLQSISLCNVANSSLDRKSHFSLNMQAGAEIAVASTKTFSASLLSLVLFAFHTRSLRLRFNSEEEALLVQELKKLPQLMKGVLNSGQFFLEIMEELKKFKSFFYLGRSFYYPIALEGALKLKEIAYLHAEAYPSGEMKHGPLAMIDKETLLLALLPPPGLLYQKSLTNIKEALSRGAGLIAIGAEADFKESPHVLTLPKTHRLLHPFLSLVPLQMMSYYVSRSYGYNADRPRNLAKSVTVE